MFIKFTQEYTPKSAGSKTYKEGEVIDCNLQSRNHFVNRGVAADLVSRKKEPEPTKKPLPSNQEIGEQSSVSQLAQASQKRTARRSKKAN